MKSKKMPESSSIFRLVARRRLVVLGERFKVIRNRETGDVSTEAK
jgi:hypothetical protein